MLGAKLKVKIELVRETSNDVFVWELPITKPATPWIDASVEAGKDTVAVRELADPESNCNIPAEYVLVLFSNMT